MVLYVPGSLPWDASPGPSHSGAWEPPPMDQREAGCGATSLPRQTQPRPVLMSWKVGPQLLALTGAGCRGRASAPGPQLGTQTLHQDIKGPAGPSGASLLHLLPPHFILCSVPKAPVLPPSPCSHGMDELGRGLWPVPNYFQMPLGSIQVRTDTSSSSTALLLSLQEAHGRDSGYGQGQGHEGRGSLERPISGLWE